MNVSVSATPITNIMLDGPLSADTRRGAVALEVSAPMPRKYSRTSAADRFWSKVDRRGPDECWPWMGTRIPRGYGQIWEAGRHRPATHVALEIAGRPLKPGEQACHTCDNPPCVNPAHLFGGTGLDNIRDMIAKGRRVLAVRDETWRASVGAGHRALWANYTPEQRLDRINRFLRGRGLPPKDVL